MYFSSKKTMTIAQHTCICRSFPVLRASRNVLICAMDSTFISSLDEGLAGYNHRFETSPVKTTEEVCCIVYGYGGVLWSEKRNGDVVDIRAGGTGDNETADGLQSMIGVVVGQNPVQIQPGGLQRIEAFSVRIAARGVSRAVGPVAADGKNCGIVQPCNTLAGGKRQLLPVRRTTVSPPAMKASAFPS